MSEIQGLINIYKPVGMTSFAVIAKLRRLTGIKRIGHCGTLDPFAEGCLPVCIGRAAGAIQYMQNYDKAYIAGLALGITTDSFDCTGQITATSLLSEDAIQSLLAHEAELLKSKLQATVGRQSQIPPMFSAIKKQGQPLYKLARQGIEVERQPRDIEVLAAKLERIWLLDSPNLQALSAFDFNGVPTHLSELLARNMVNLGLEINWHVSKGTYIRTLADDFAKTLQTRAFLYRLIRHQVGPFNQSNSVHLDELTSTNWQEYLLPIEFAINNRVLNLSRRQGLNLINGQKIPLAEIDADLDFLPYIHSYEEATPLDLLFKVYAPSADLSAQPKFLGMAGAKCQDDNLPFLHAERIFIDREDY